jgi:hypothetical protein
MKERDLDGGSAAPATPDVDFFALPLGGAPTRVSNIEPATPDVPTGDRATDLRTPERWLHDSEFAGIEILDYDGWRGAEWRTPITVQEFRRRLWLCTITGPVYRRPPDHSGVAGEPEATTKEASVIDSPAPPTQVPVPDPVDPAALNLAGGPPPSAEAVARAFHEAYERLAPSFSYETRKASAVPWERVPENNRALMTAVAAEVAPLVAAQALRSAAGTLRAQIGTLWGLGDAVIWLQRRADELERGTDQ